MPGTLSGWVSGSRLAQAWNSPDAFAAEAPVSKVVSTTTLIGIGAARAAGASSRRIRSKARRRMPDSEAQPVALRKPCSAALAGPPRFAEGLGAVAGAGQAPGQIGPFDRPVVAQDAQHEELLGDCPGRACAPGQQRGGGEVEDQEVGLLAGGEVAHLVVELHGPGAGQGGAVEGAH